MKRDSTGESCHVSSRTLASSLLPREEDGLSWEEESPFTGGHFGHLPPPTGPCLTPRLFVASPVSGLRGKIHKTSKRRKPRQGLCNVQGTRAEQLPGLEGQGPALTGATETADTSHPRREQGKGQGTFQAEGPGEHKPSSISWQVSPSIPFPCKWFHWFLQAVDSTSFTVPTAWVHLVKFSSFWKLRGGERFSSMATFKA